MLQIRGLSLSVPGRRLLEDVDLEIAAGECVAVVGPSGTGKTTLLNCAAGIVKPESGTVVVDGTEISYLSSEQRSNFRLHKIGVVFQFAELLPELSALENVALPSRLAGIAKQEAETRAELWLDRFGVAQHRSAHGDALSGGEQQRVGLARSMAHDPVFLVADEPTGMLDEGNSRIVVNLLVATARMQGTAVLLTTHDPDVAAAADRVLRIHDGSLIPANNFHRSPA